MHVHMVGVSGTGMGALAGLFRAAGHRVSGSDVAFDPPMGPALEAWGIELLRGYAAEHLASIPDLVVVGNVCRRDNPEAVAAFAKNLAVRSMPHALHELVLSRTAPLVVAGTHGKTTTTALAAHLLFATRAPGRKPGFLVGGLPKNFDQSFRLPDDFHEPVRSGLPIAGAPTGGRKTPFVIEGDEYDSAFFEKTPKFWHYGAEVAIVGNVEHDHVDIYPDDASYDAAFREFVARVPERGLLVANAADPRVVELARAAKCEVVYTALEGDDTHGCPPHYLAAPATEDASGQSFDLFVGGVAAGRAAMRMPGKHNLRNAIAALAACAHGYGAPVKSLVTALAAFEGVRRRQDLLFEARGVRVYDDFAHHPSAVDQTLRALRARHPEGALWAVFEPRSATACRALHQAQYADAFGVASRVVLAPLGRADIAPAERLDLVKLAQDLTGRGVTAECAASVDGIVTRVLEDAKPGDTVVLMSNGAFGGIHGKLREGFGAEGSK